MSRIIPHTEKLEQPDDAGSAAFFIDADMAQAAGPFPDEEPSLQGTAQRNQVIVLLGLMGAGKTTIGKRLAQRLGLPFVDADAEIERAAGCSIGELFTRHGESEFRKGERRVIQRLLDGQPKILATGGGAFMDAQTRELVRTSARSVWLRCTLPVLMRRVAGKTTRPLLLTGDPQQIMEGLMAARYPVYAQADIIVDCGDDTVDQSTSRVIASIEAHAEPHYLPVSLDQARYDVVIGRGLIERAGALLAPVIPQKRAVIITDEHVAGLYLQPLLDSLSLVGIRAHALTIRPGEESKNLTRFGQLVDSMLELGVERRTSVIALGGGVVGDLAGFVAAATLRGLPFVQIPTTLLSQVDSSVGGKTGINSRFGKNLIGAFHQPIAVLADIAALESLPRREIIAGYAEIVKAGLIADPALFAWCETNGQAVLDRDPEAMAEAVRRACAFKARVVADDEKEEKGADGRALLNLGHTFGHALEAEMGYDGRLLHGEAVSIGLKLAFALSVKLGFCAPTELARLADHLQSLGMPDSIASTGHQFSARTLVSHMARDKKMRDGKLSFVLVRAIGRAFTCRDVPDDAVAELLLSEGCLP